MNYEILSGGLLLLVLAQWLLSGGDKLDVVEAALAVLTDEHGPSVALTRTADSWSLSSFREGRRWAFAEGCTVDELIEYCTNIVEAKK